MFQQGSAYNTGAINSAANANAAEYNANQTTGLGALQQGFNGANGAINNAIDAYRPLANLGTDLGRGTSAYEDALGLNGDQGNQRAVDNFHAGPGYQFAVDQGTDAVARKAASLGIAGSGNTLDAVRSRAQGFADQEYGNYVNRLGGFVPQQLQATGQAAAGNAAGYGARAGLFTNNANQQVGVGNTATAGQVGVNSAQAGALVGNQNYLTGGLTGTNDQAASANAASNNQAAQADMQGSQNFWNGLLSLGLGAAKIYAGAPTPKAV